MSAVMFDSDFVSILMMPPPDKTEFDLTDPMQQQRFNERATEYLAVKQTAITESARNNILISGAVWFELQAFVFPDGTTLASRLAQHTKVLVEEIDVSVIDLAGELLRERRKIPTFCPRCLAVDGAKPCTVCGRLGSKLNKTTDALVVAHAAVLEKRKSVTTLYTLDGGPMELARGLPKRGYAVTVGHPPNPSGPLFATAPAPALAPASTPAVATLAPLSHPKSEGKP
jgi:hypothetical protein